METPLLSIQDLRVKLPAGADRPDAVSGVSLDLKKGEILCVVGESGSGKSVIAHAIMGLLPRELSISGGKISFNGNDLTQQSAEAIRLLRGREIGMIFQEPMSALNPVMKIGRQLTEVLEAHGQRDKRKNRQCALEWLEKVGLAEPERIFGAYPFRLSGGQRQRAMIAMALILGPKILIADEPTTALDVTTQKQILDLVKSLQRERNMGVLFITHDFGVVAEIADRIAVMERGQLVEQGLTRDVLEEPKHPYTRRLIAAVPKLKGHLSSQEDEAADDFPIMKLEKMSKIFRVRNGLFGGMNQIKAVRDVSLTLRQGETLGVVGESGSGKSTLARCLVRLEEPDTGKLLFKGEQLIGMRQSEFRRLRPRIQMVFQDPFASLNPRRKIVDIICQGPLSNGVARPIALQRAKDLLKLVGLDVSALERYPHEFSGGQRQRIGIARALALEPDVLIADEPVSALDVSVQAQVLDLLKDIRARMGLTMIFITHDLVVAAEICDRIAVMRHGEIVELGSTAQVFGSPSHAYTKNLLASVPGRDWVLAPVLASQYTDDVLDRKLKVML